MSVVVVGLNRTAPLEMLERMTVSAANLPKALFDLQTRPHINEAVILSTCMRTEVYVVAERFHGALGDVRNFLAELSFLAPENFSDHLYSYYEDAAAAHLFKVAAGLDSAVVGEGEILGQVRQAEERARAEGASGPMLAGLFRHAVEVGKRVRSDTSISRGVTSISQAAVAMADERLGGLAGRSILVLGVGDMGRGMAESLAGSAGVVEVLVANRTPAKASALAAKVGGRAVGLDRLPEALEHVDVLLSATGGSSIVLEASDLEAVLEARQGRPLLAVDMAVPRDIAPDAAELPGLTLLDMDDLQAFVAVGMAERRREAARAREIVAEEVERYLATATQRTVAPVVAALRERAEQVRLAELERFAGRLDGLDRRQREAVEALTRGIVGKLLHEPTVRLKEAAGSVRGERQAESLRALFDL